MTLKNLEVEVVKIKERNAKVERDKKWETSFERRALIAVLTYTVMVLFFSFAAVPNPFINAIVPTIGFVLSTLTLAFFKERWLKQQK